MNQQRAKAARRGRMLWAAGLLTLVVAATSCGKTEQGAKGAGGPTGRGPIAFPVEVRPVASARVEYSVNAVGQVEAFERVQVTARVGGVVDRVSFTEGMAVKKGQMLAEIEPSRYRLGVKAARAALEKAEAAAAEAQAGLTRRESVEASSPGLIRGEELDTWRTRARTAGAEAHQARVALEQAQLNLNDALLRAPVAGTIETRSVQTGQYLQPGAVVATLVQRDPLLLKFQVSEQDAGRLRVGMLARFRVRNQPRLFEARLTHVAQSADERSRMVQIIGDVTQGADALVPGTFAEVTVPVEAAEAAVVIPQRAVRPSERGFLAYVIEGDLARERVLSLGMRTSRGEVEVRSGLRPGERLVVRGNEPLKEGAKVRVVESTEKAEEQPLRRADDGGAGGAP